MDSKQVNDAPLEQQVIALQIDMDLVKRELGNIIQAFQDATKQIESMQADILTLKEKGK